MKVLTFTLSSLLACCLCSRAQDKPQPQTPAQKSTTAAPSSNASPDGGTIDPQKERDIRKLLDLTGTKTRMTELMAEMEKGIKPMMLNSLPEGPYREQLIDAFFVKFHAKADTQQLIDAAVLVYDRHFTHQDIKGLIQFYETPLGQKTSTVLPKVMTEMMDQGRQFGESLGRQSMLEVLAEHPDWERSMEDAAKNHHQ